MNLLQKLEQEQVEHLSKGKKIPNFRAGDTVRVNVRVVEGDRTRTQSYEGVVIGRKNAGLRSTFRVRKLSSGEGVERVFHLYSPNITVEVVRQGRVRRSKLYYLRERTGKRARITELKNSGGVTFLHDGAVNEAEELAAAEAVAEEAVQETVQEAPAVEASAPEATAEAPVAEAAAEEAPAAELSEPAAEAEAAPAEEPKAE